LRKIVIIINGKGGSGKDTICDIVAKYFSVINISSIDPIKQVAASLGWTGEKDDSSRLFLSALKRISSDYNNYPTQYLCKCYEDFLKNESSEILFAHIREPEQIYLFKNNIRGECITLLITRASVSDHNNDSDDNVDNYHYDYYFDNSGELDTLECKFMEFFNLIIGDLK